MSAPAKVPTREQINERRKTRGEWYGYLADDTVEHIGMRIRTMLAGRRYTFVANDTDVSWVLPEVRSGQALKPQHASVAQGTPGTDGLTVHRMGEPSGYGEQKRTFCGITGSDTYGVWGIHSWHATEAEAHEDARDEKRVKSTTYVHIVGGLDQGHRNEQIRIVQYAGTGHKLHWVISVEPKSEEEG